jgi:hypothetical protein
MLALQSCAGCGLFFGLGIVEEIGENVRIDEGPSALMELVSSPAPPLTFRCAALAASTAILLGQGKESTSRASLSVCFAGKRVQALGKDGIDARALFDGANARSFQHFIVDGDRQIRHDTVIV